MTAEDRPENETDSPDSSGEPLATGTPEVKKRRAYSPQEIFRKIYSNRFLTRRLFIWRKRRLLPLLGLLIAVGIMVGVFLLYRAYPDFFRDPNLFPGVEGLRYLSVFIISIIFNATIILPVSNIAVIISMGATLPSPALVGIAGGAGAAIGEMTGYLAGRSGRNLLRRSKVYTRVEGWVKKWGWIAVFVMSVFPFVFDIVGIIAGALRMPVWRFVLAAGAGRAISYIAVAYLADLGFQVFPWLD